MIKGVEQLGVLLLAILFSGYCVFVNNRKKTK